jgi:hypothetical protein
VAGVLYVMLNMKVAYTLFTSLILSSLAYSEITIQGIDFTKQKSIQKTLDSINVLRSSQNVILHLEPSSAIKIIEGLSGSGIDYIDIKINKGGVVDVNRSEFMTWDAFLKRLTIYRTGAKAAGVAPSLIVYFDEEVSGIEGVARLKQLSSLGVQLVMCKTIEEVPPKPRTSPPPPPIIKP